MNNLAFATLIQGLIGKAEKRILIVGLNNAGKSTILNKLNVGNIVTTIPVKGFSAKHVEYKNIKFTLFDLGQPVKFLPTMRHYYSNTSGLIFVIDSSDTQSMVTAKIELHAILQENGMSDIPLLIYANKQDVDNASTASQITVSLNLHTIRHRNWFIQSTCATNGDGLCEGLDWMVKTLSKK